MDLLQNPFYILSVSLRDNRRRIQELADEKSLFLDSSKCLEARSELTNPRKRLSAEVAWLPGIGPKRVEEIIKVIDEDPSEFLEMNNLHPISQANALVSGLCRLEEIDSEELKDWIIAVADAFEDVVSEDLRIVINEERVVSGFPEVSDLSVIESEIESRRHYYLQVIKSSLDQLSAEDLVDAITKVVEEVTDYGDESGPVLIADLIDSYEVEAQGFLQKEEENIKRLTTQLREAGENHCSDSVLNEIVEQLIGVVENWDRVAQPIQLSTKSRGLQHEASVRVANLVRSVAITMYNKHQKLEISQKLNNMLKEVFAEVVEVAERSDSDEIALNKIAEDRNRYEEEERKRSREIYFEADVGLIFKERLRISSEGIDWQEQHWDLDTITWVRWGGTSHSVNGIPTGTTYNIYFGSETTYGSIDLRRKSTYLNFVSCLWKSVGVRLFTEYMQGLKEGKRYIFGDVIVSDLGVEFKRWKLFGKDEEVFCKWSSLQIWNANGAFCIDCKDDKSLNVSLSYLQVNNVHILEAAIRMLFEKGGERLSCVLNG